MTSQAAEQVNTSRRNTWSEFLTRCKEPTAVVLSVLGVIGILGSAFVGAASWFVDREVEILRRELIQANAATRAALEALRNEMRTGEERRANQTTALNHKTEGSGARISENSERIARLQATLAGTSGTVDRLHTLMTKNLEAITELKSTRNTRRETARLGKTMNDRASTPAAVV